MSSDEKIVIHQWRVLLKRDSVYQAPELASLRISGFVYGHPKFPDGRGIVTSRIVNVTKRRVTTLSGSQYFLGRIDLSYRRFLRTYEPEWDWRNPITILS